MKINVNGIEMYYEKYGREDRSSWYTATVWTTLNSRIPSGFSEGILQCML